MRLENDVSWGVVSEALKILKLASNDLKLFREEYV